MSSVFKLCEVSNHYFKPKFPPKVGNFDLPIELLTE